MGHGLLNPLDIMPTVSKLGRLAYAITLAVVLGVNAGETPATAQAPEPNANPEAAFEHCRQINDDATRLNCFESFAETGDSHQPDVLGTWRLVRTPNPNGGRPAVSIMQIADVARSDLGLAGLMLRCGDNAIEILIVLVRYLPPNAHPVVTVRSGLTDKKYTGRVVPPGLMVLLPPEAMSLALGPWQKAADVAVNVNDDQGSIHGVVPLTGLKGALQLLQSSCPAR